MSLGNILTDLIEKAGKIGIEQVDQALEELICEADTPWKKMLLQLTGEALDCYGLQGLDRVSSLIDNIISGKNDNLEFASLRTRSDYLALIQGIEAEEKKKAKDFFRRIGLYLSVVLKAIISGLLSKK